MSLVVREVHDAAELEAVVALRFEVRREESRTDNTADRESRLTREPLDETGRVLIAIGDDGEVVGTARINFSRSSNLELYETWYGMRAFEPFHPADTAIVTRLMVAPRLRHSSLAVRIAMACYAVALAENIAFAFTDCSPPSKNSFESLGFRQLAPCFAHPEDGTVHPMVLAVWDRTYLREIGSPFMSMHSSRTVGTPVELRSSVELFRSMCGGCLGPENPGVYERNAPAEEIPTDPTKK